MNILIITTEYGLEGGGMSLSCTRLMDILSTKHHVHVSFSTDNPIRTARGGINPSIEDGIRKEYKLKEDIVKYRDIDIIIGFGGRYNGYYASLLAERLCVRYVLNLRGSDINITKWSVEDYWYMAEACRRASKIICLSQEMVDNVLSISPKSNGKITIIPNELGVKTGVYHFPNLPQKLVLGSAASHLNEKKGIGNLLCMVAEFQKKSNIPIFLELIGDVDTELKDSYTSIISELGIRKNVFWGGSMLREKLHNHMSGWDFYVQASVCEGHSNSVSEALELGCAFISSKTGYIAELLKDEFPFLFFKSFAPEEMASGLLNLIKIPNLDRYYDCAWRKLAEKCNKETILDKWHNLLTNNTSFHQKLEIENVLAVGLHDVSGDIHDSITTPVYVFQQFVDFINRRGYGLCSMREYLKKTKEERKQYVVCTFDDGYKNLISIVKPILAKYGYTATVCICTDLLGKDNRWNNKDAMIRQHLNESDLVELYRAGWEIASHGVTHRNLLKLSDTEIDHELSESNRILTGIFGEVITYAYPYGAYNNYIKNCVGKYYKYAFAVSQGGTSLAVDQFQLRRYSISDIYKMLSV